MDKILAKIIESILNQMSDQLRTELVNVIKRLEALAAQTKNPWDDLLVLILKIALGTD